MLKKKKCLITIKNKDDLCASRDLVTMQALADGDPQYKNIRLGRGQQGYLAHKLCQEAGVTEGPCGAEEMQQFQDHLGPQGYQIIVFEGQRGMIWFKDRAYNDASKKICLLKVQNHFHGLRSIPALLNRSYYCHHCEKGYNQETSENHNCLGQNCSSCKRTNGSCPNFATYVTPEVYCDQCNQKFYGQNCYDAHKRGANSVCSRFKKCHECCQVYKFCPKKKHHCYHALCRNCKEVTLVNHRCFIQPIVDEDKTAWGPRMVSEDADEERMMEFEEAENEGDSEGKEKVEPMICAMDFECTQNEIEEFEVVRVGWKYLGEIDSYQEAGTAMDLLHDAQARTVTEDGKERKVYVYAHNMRGFDSSFLLHALYDLGYQIVKVLSVGAKYLSFECGNLIFRDSLNFFNMALEKLRATFNLTETHKGFFAYSWIRESKYGYVDAYPPAEDYHPERMSEKRRKEFYAWHKEKVESGAIFDFKKELSAYLHSDVEVLFQSLEAFGKEMVELTGINPVIECVTIASTANKVWRKNFLIRDLIALEPKNGWRQNQQNQSVEALQWWEFENSKIGGGIQVRYF